ncbi:MAG: CpaF family protein [Anaerolineae bacterium]|nr:CpaF family protein [Anaerolineae bacterium]
MLRPKMLAHPAEADTWFQNERPDKIEVMVGRLQRLLKMHKIALVEDGHASLQWKPDPDKPDEMPPSLSKLEYKELEARLLDDLLGFGAIEPLIQDKSFSEIMVNGPDMICAEFKGKVSETEVIFDDEEHVQWVAQRIVRPLGRKFDRDNPMVDARLPDGSRVHLIMPPSALCGTTITIRKFPEKPLTVDDLIRFGSFTKEVSEFLKACVISRLNIVVSGGTGSGKTTLLNVLSAFIPGKERIITVEDSAELQLTQRHVVRLETAPPTPEGTGKLEIRDLVKGCLRMRPDRIVVGECRSGEALDMLQAMNTGHDGSLTTVHANSPRDCIARLETLVLMAGMDLPVYVIRKQIASAVHLIIQQTRLNDGSRKITYITELQGMEGDAVVMQDLFVYRTPGQRNPGASHEGGGTLEPAGFRPSFIHILEQHGCNLPASVFGAGQQKFSSS